MEIKEIRILDAPAEGVCDVETGICEIPAEIVAENP